MKNTLKGILIGSIVTLILVILLNTVYAETLTKSINVVFDNIKIFLDGKEIETKDVNGNLVEPFIYQNSTYVPIRAVSSALGFDVDWDSGEKTVLLTESTQNKKEIERKWLIDKNNIPYDLDKADKYKIVQTYINFSPEIRLRDINNGEAYIITIKANMSVDGLVRDEQEYFITKDEYLHLLSKQEGTVINKNRYQFYDKNGVHMAIDIFQGDLSGLAYLEIQFDSVAEANAFMAPDWVIKDVTDDARYKNGSLARNGIPEL